MSDPAQTETEPGPDDISAVEAAIYDESFRTMSEQAKVLDGLRTRAGTLVAVANVATAFVGGFALARHPAVVVVHGQVVGRTHLDAVAWTAVAFFCSVFGLSLAILIPTRKWVFWHHPHLACSSLRRSSFGYGY